MDSGVLDKQVPALSSLGDVLPHCAAKYGDAAALVAGERRYTYRELNDLAARAAGALHQRGIRPGDVVSLLGPNSWQWLVSYHAIVRAGAVVNPLNVMLTATEVGYAMRDCESTAVLTTAERLPSIRSLAPTLPAMQFAAALDGAGDDSLAALLDAAPLPALQAVDARSLSTIGYTSGTTGHPKGAMQSHEAVLLNCALTATMHGRTHSDVLVTALPLSHVYGNVAVTGTLLAGGTVVLMERFDAAQALALITEHRATMFEGVPAMYSMLLASPALDTADLSTLRVCTVGGQTIAVATVQSWQARSSAPLLELWGMTEISGLGATHAIYAPNVPGSIGMSLPGVELRVASLDDVTRDAPDGETGELMVRGPIVMLGYFGNPEATARTIEANGWLHTGDMAIKHASGHFAVVDRRSDLIITAGYNVYPAEIERVLSSHPDVALVAVGPIRDETKGELACAYVVRRDGATVTERELIEFTRDRLAAYKLPRRVVFVAALPSTSSGKVMRHRLTELLGTDS